MELQGTVRNVVDFGAVDCVEEDGLVHISKMLPSIKRALDVVSVGDIIKV